MEEKMSKKEMYEKRIGEFRLERGDLQDNTFHWTEVFNGLSFKRLRDIAEKYNFQEGKANQCDTWSDKYEILTHPLFPEIQYWEPKSQYLKNTGNHPELILNREPQDKYSMRGIFTLEDSPYGDDSVIFFANPEEFNSEDPSHREFLNILAEIYGKSRSYGEDLIDTGLSKRFFESGEYQPEISFKGNEKDLARTLSKKPYNLLEYLKDI